MTLTGRLTDPAGAPIAGALLQLTQQVVGSTTPSAVASTTTNSTGAWTLKVPKGPSRLLRVAYYSHLLDTVPAAALAFHERVKAAVSLTAPRRVRGRAAVCLHRPLGRRLHPIGRRVDPDGDPLRRALAHDRSAANQRAGAGGPTRTCSLSEPARLPVSEPSPYPMAPTRSCANKSDEVTREGSLGVVRPVLPP